MIWWVVVVVSEWVKVGRQCPNWHYQNFHLIAMKKAIYIKNNNNNNYNDTHYLLLRITLLSADGALCGGGQPATFLNKSSLLVAGSLSSLYHPLAFIIVLSPLILTLRLPQMQYMSFKKEIQKSYYSTMRVNLRLWIKSLSLSYPSLDLVRYYPLCTLIKYARFYSWSSHIPQNTSCRLRCGSSLIN